MSNILHLADIHHKIEIADQILELERGNYNKVVFTGDAFDDFSDSVEESEKTARWYLEKLHDPNWICLKSNHDIAYEFSFNGYVRCSGFSQLKGKAINQIIDRDSWNKTKLFHYENEFLFSHAGLNKWLLDWAAEKGYCEMYQYKIEQILPLLTKWENDGHQMLMNNGPHFIYEAGIDRGGVQRYGGLTWGDFRSHCVIEGVRQCAGHTPSTYPQIQYISKKNRTVATDVNSPILKHTKVDYSRGVNYCLDTHLNHYSLIKENSIEIYEIKFDKPRKEVGRHGQNIIGKELIYKKEF